MKSSAFIFIFFWTLFFSSQVYSQELSLSGFVYEDSGYPIAYANVLLMKSQDSTLIRGVSTDENGYFKMDKLSRDNYLLKISFIGFEDFYKPIFLDQTLVLDKHILKESTEALDEISITVKNPTLKKESDRLIFNIEKTALTEGNMFEVLKSTPGILVMNNSLQVKNTSPTVYINDRKVHLNDEELVQLLEGSSANNIKSVEVITSPGAQYDAESASVINIKMSKNLISGYRGNIATYFTQGVFPRYNAATSHFFKNERLDFFANYSFSQDKINRDHDEITVYYDLNGTKLESFESQVNRNTWSKTHNFNFNLDYEFNDRNTLSLSSQMMIIPHFRYKLNNQTRIVDQNENLKSYFDSNNLSKDDQYNLGFDLDYVHKFDRDGEKLALNAHFTTFDYDRNQKVNSDYYKNDLSFLESTAFRTANHQDTHIFTLKGDYNLPLNEASNLIMGVKGSQIESNSNLSQYDIVNSVEIIDVTNSNDFNYKEKIGAAYFNLSTEYKSLKLVAGLRTEYTGVESESRSSIDVQKSNYLEWFPSASVSYDISEATSIYSNYKRSIQRPNYESLNPFKFYFNDYNIFSGNPNLKPVITDYAVLGTALSGGTFVFEAYYKKQYNNITELPLQDNNTRILNYMPVNLDHTTEFGLDFISYFSVVENWSVYFLTSVYKTIDKAELEGISLSRNRISNLTMLNNDFTFLKDRSLNMNLSLTYLSKSLMGFKELKDILQSELSISKTILKNRATVSLMVSDIFNTQDFDLTSKYLNQDNSTIYNQDTRYIKVGFRYKFGNTYLETNQRTTSQEEIERLEKSGN